MANRSTVETDVILIGAGIMSATLGMLLKQLNPAIRIEIVERLDNAAAESSDAWNNAGTGHSAFCELNYTPQKEDGSVDITKAIKIAESFEVSKQFWAYLVANNIIELPDSFIKPIPHMSFVWGGKNVALLKSKIPESKGFGGFPVSGQWLRCTNTAVIEQHGAKVYGAAAVGSPPMSVPHLDTRWIKGKRELLFGPYAGFTTKFLKSGSLLDLFRSIKLSNIKAMLFAGARNLPLTKYLIDQVRLTPDERLEALREYYPNARKEDWELAIAGYRVQVIKKDDEEGGILEFGTEVVSAADGSIAALLGASPGASTAVSIMIDLVHRCFKDQVNSADWQKKLKEMIPSYGSSLGKDAALAQEIRAYTGKVLQLQQLS